MDQPQYYPLTAPIDYVYRATSYTIQVSNIDLNKSAEIFAVVFTADRRIVDNKIYYLTGEEYDLWLSDDYLINWVRIQLEKDGLIVKLPLSP